ncbi:CDF family Co(II)/Ni(II) efflux transporter DmeF [Vogesella sp. GCM10023246]|uniref:CDF family Co(II)/Ni(II) efflux transporter DmeF n=1 Tax=Vogesella oryzagri TaxID=3160864 RepID=A0ABV1M2L2_9NEIS
MNNRTHTHVFHLGNPLAQRNTRWAVWLTAITMVVEICGGWWFNSMALLADGWHMSSHALALGLSVLAYAAARRYAYDKRFAFGTWKIEILGGFSSALLLLGVAGLMLVQSLQRLLNPSAIHYDQAIVLALLGLLVNLLCAWLLHAAGHQHEHDHHHGHHHHGHDHHAHDDHHDLNLRSAYLHVLADAATSVLAIVALFAGKLWGAAWLDPVMGIAGAVLVAVWAKGLLQQAGKVLLDAEMDAPQVAEIHDAVASLQPPASITDLHLWRVGQGSYACIVAVETSGDATPDQIRGLLAVHEELAHITVEINRPLR